MMDFTWPTFIYTVVNFLILVGLLSYFLHKPLLRVLADRQKKIEDSFREAEEKSREADAARQEYEERIAGVEEERDRMLTEARERAEKARVELVEKAKREAEREVANLKRDWERQSRDALNVLESDIVGAALELAGRVLEQLADAGVEAKLHAQLLSQLDALGGQAGAAEMKASAGPVRVVSAVALDEAAGNSLKERLAALAGDAVEVSFDVDGSLIAGSRVEFSSQAVDSTLADALAAVRERFNRLSSGPEEEAS